MPTRTNRNPGGCPCPHTYLSTGNDDHTHKCTRRSRYSALWLVLGWFCTPRSISREFGSRTPAHGLMKRCLAQKRPFFHSPIKIEEKARPAMRLSGDLGRCRRWWRGCTPAQWKIGAKWPRKHGNEGQSHTWARPCRWGRGEPSCRSVFGRWPTCRVLPRVTVFFMKTLFKHYIPSTNNYNSSTMLSRLCFRTLRTFASFKLPSDYDISFMKGLI